ncbi:MAG: glycosyltransferase family 39 protein [Candidatus Omnitrophota bacterium]|jgi:hypothetical protein
MDLVMGAKYLAWLCPVGCVLAAAKIGRLCFPGAFLRDRYLLVLFHAGAGLVIFSMVLFAAVLMGLATRPVLWRITSFCLILGLHELIRLISGIRGKRSLLRVHLIPVTLLSVYFFLQGILTLLPPTACDETIYHLYVPQKWLEMGGKYFFADNIYAYFPQLADLYFLLGLGTLGEPAAKFFHVTWGALLAGAIFRVSRKWLGPRQAWCPVFVWLLIPSVLVTMHWAYVDLTFAFYAFMALVLLMEYRDIPSRRTWAGCALMAGGAAATKYTGIQFALILACLFMILHRRRQARQIWEPILVLGGLAGLVLSPYLVRNFIQTGYPLFPFAFPGLTVHSVNWDPDRAMLFVSWLQTFGTRIGEESAWDTLWAPIRIFIKGRFFDHVNFDGIIGPTFLLIPFFFREIKKDSGLRVLGLFSLFFVVYWTLTTKQVRFFFPVLPALSILLVCGAARVGGKRLLGVVMVLAAGFSWLGFREIVRVDPVPYLSGEEGREEFLRRRIDVYPIYKESMKQLGPDDKVYLLDMRNHGYFLDKPWTGDYVFEHYNLERFLKGLESPKEVGRFFSDRGVTHLLVGTDITFSETMGLEKREALLFSSFLRENALPLLARRKHIFFKLKETGEAT